MRNFFTSAAIFTAFLFIQSIEKNEVHPEESTGILFFEGTWQEAILKAKKENKLIFLDAYTTWCGPCKAMQKNIFPNEKVGELFNKNFINVKIDMEKGEGIALAKKYNVRAYPTLFFIDAQETLKLSSLGYHNVSQLIKLGQKALK